MNLESVFSFVSTLALFSWIALFIFYSQEWIYRLLFSGILIILALIYLYFISVGLYSGGNGGFGSLAEVRILFEKDEALLAGWIHYLAFDLFVGMWTSRDAWLIKVNRWLLLACLLFTFMLGPIGFLIYFILRSVKTKTPVQSI